MKVFLDTNVWLRYLLQDNEQSESCTRLFELIDTGHIQPYTSSTVFLEIYFVMTSPRLYAVEKNEILKDLQKLMSLRNLTIIEASDIKRAVDLSLKQRLKLADALIVTQVPQKVVLCTYDNELKKIQGTQVINPEEVVAGFV